jgi:hypothetical protein
MYHEARVADGTASTMDSTADNGVVRRLGQYRPFEGAGAGAREAQEDLVLAALAERDGPCRGLEQCQEDIAVLFGIKLDRMEVARAVRELEREERVTTSGAVALTSTEAQRLRSIAEETAQVEAAAIREWRELVKGRWTSIDDKSLDRLENELDLYLRTVFRRHGAEAALILYPDDPRAANLFSALEEQGFDFLPHADEPLASIREGAFSELMRRPTPSQQQYLGRMMNTASFLTVLSIDPEGAELVREVAAGQRVYLDTNFLFRLLGIQGPRFMLPARTILARTQEAGYCCAVTPWTVTEFQRALRHSHEYLARYPVPPSEYAALAADAASEEDFVTAYWRKVKDEPGLKAEDFLALYAELEPHLAASNITIETEGCTAVEDHDEGAVEEDISILERALMAGHGGPRGLERLRHDARHRQLVLRLRGTSNRSFANAGYWFLTHDSLLPRYDFMARGGKSPDPPFCVSAGAWFQVVEAFRPKTDDDERTFADLLASPYVRYRRTLSKTSAQAVAARLALHKDVTPELAATLFMNSFLMKEIEDTADPEAKIERIDNAIVEAAKQAQKQAEAALQYAEEVQERAAAATAEAEAQVEREAEASERAIKDAEERRERALADERERRDRELADEKARTDERIRAAEERHDQRLRQRDSEIAAQAAELANLKRLLKVAGIVLVLGAIFVAGAIALGVEEAWIYLVGLGAVVGVVAGIDQLLSRASDSS